MKLLERLTLFILIGVVPPLTGFLGGWWGAFALGVYGFFMGVPVFNVLLGLPFTVTRPMIVAIILVGGASILLLQWWLTRTTLRRAYLHLMKNT